jgi:hypothetical protein
VLHDTRLSTAMRPCQRCSMLSLRVASLEARLMQMAGIIQSREAQLEAPRRRQISDAEREQRRQAGQSRARYALPDELNRFV